MGRNSVDQVGIYDSRQFMRVNQVVGNRRVCALTRVSTQHEQQTNALVNQNQWIIDEISRHEDWLFDLHTDLYTDAGISGTSLKKRVEFNEMIQRAKSGQYDLIVTREVCRFMRNARLTLTLVDELEKCGVEVYFVNDGIWSFNKDDYFKLTIMSTYAEQESRKTSERVLSGQAVSRANGVQYGTGNILGYDLVKGIRSIDTTYVINEEQADTVRKIYELVLCGMGMKKIKHYLEENGHKTAKGKSKWYESTIERILRNKTYRGDIEYFKSYTEDPLTHERVSQLDRDRRVVKEGKHPAIIEVDMWNRVQEVIDSRLNHVANFDKSKKQLNGIVVNKNVYCRKMRCGCGRRFKLDLGRVDGTGTYRCYSLIDDGSQEKRLEKSLLLEDNCSVQGIIDWKLDLFTLKVFNCLSYNLDAVKERLLLAIEKSYVCKGRTGYSETDKIKLEDAISRFDDRLDRLLDMRVDGELSKEDYDRRKAKIEEDKVQKQQSLKNILVSMSDVDRKDETLNAVKEFLDDVLDFPKVKGNITQIPEPLIETYVNSIKACANNVFEYNIRVNPQAEVISPLVCPDEEYNSFIHPAMKHIDNSKAVLLAEFTVDYELAKQYANSLKKKVKRVHWEVPAIIRVYANI